MFKMFQMKVNMGEVLENFRRHMETEKEPNENTEKKNHGI